MPNPQPAAREKYLVTKRFPTPPAGNRALTHPDRDVRVTKSPLTKMDSEWPEDETSGVHESQEAMLASRTKRTLTQLSGLRKEVQDSQQWQVDHGEADLVAQREVKDEITSLGTRMDTRIDGVGERVDGALTVFLDTFAKTQTAKTEVEKTDQIAKIEDTKDSKKFKRTLVLKILALATPVVAAITTGVTLLASGKC